MTLFINACVRRGSRTKKLADRILAKEDGPIEEVRLEEIGFPAADGAFLKRRDALIAEGRFDDPLFALARQFARAEKVVIAAPYWDLSFPATLKQYFEQINVIGVTFCYTAEGSPQGLCRAKRLIYVTTAGGIATPDDYGFGYVKALAQRFYGIPELRLVKAAGLDVIGADEKEILERAVAEFENNGWN